MDFDFGSHEESLYFVRTMIRLIVYNLIYNRIEYAEENFYNSSVEPVYKMLQRNCPDSSLRKFKIWDRDVIKEIATKNTRRIFLLVHCRATNEILEQFNIIINYPNDINERDTQTMLQDTKKLVSTFKKLRRYQTYKPEAVSISIHVLEKIENEEDSSTPMCLVNSEDTPDTYDCAFFEELGEVLTNHHKLTVFAFGKTTEKKDQTVSKEEPEMTKECLILELDADEMRMICGNRGRYSVSGYIRDLNLYMKFHRDLRL